MNVTGSYARHHRIPWELLLDVLQRTLEGVVDPRVIGHLLTLSPRPTRELATRFAAAAHQFRIGGPFQRGQGQVIAEVEQELFSLPCNLFQGLSNRADDPERLGPRFMDFTPSDVLHTGSLPEGIHGQLQRARERVFALLLAGMIDARMVQEACWRWRELWTIHGGGLNCATAHQHQWWAPGGMPFAQPPYRYWINAAGGALTAEQSSRLNLIVFRRAIG